MKVKTKGRSVLALKGENVVDKLTPGEALGVAKNMIIAAVGSGEVSND